MSKKLGLVFSLLSVVTLCGGFYYYKNKDRVVVYIAQDAGNYEAEQQLLEKILKEMKLKDKPIEFDKKIVPFDSMLQSVAESSKAIGAGGISQTNEREQNKDIVFFPYGVKTSLTFVKIVDTKATNPSCCVGICPQGCKKNCKLATQPGTTFAKFLDDKKQPFIAVQDLTDLFEKLKKGEVSCILVDGVAANDFSDKNRAALKAEGKEIILRSTNVQYNLAYILSNKNPEFVEAFKQAFKDYKNPKKVVEDKKVETKTEKKSDKTHH